MMRDQAKIQYTCINSDKFASPPKPSRLSSMKLPGQGGGSLSHHQTTTQVPCNDSYSVIQKAANMAADFEGQMVEMAVTSIPQVMSEVFTAQQGQADEIQKQKAMLATLKGNIAKEQENNCEEEQEILCVTNRAGRTDERAKELRLSLKHLATDIQSLICQKHDLQLAVNRLEDSMLGEKRHFKKYRDKTYSHSKKTIEYEKQHSAVFVQLQEVIDSVNKLKFQNKEFEVISDEEWNRRDKELLSSIECLKTTLLEKETSSRELETKLKEEEDKQGKIQGNIHVLQKRSAAQIKRLKTQRKDVELRIRQKQSQIQRLKDNLHRASEMLEA